MEISIRKEKVHKINDFAIYNMFSYDVYPISFFLSWLTCLLTTSYFLSSLTTINYDHNMYDSDTSPEMEMDKKILYYRRQVSKMVSISDLK